MVIADPSISIRRLALTLHVSYRKIWKILHRENLHPYHLTPVQGLLPEDLPTRLEFSNWLLQREFEDDNFINNILWTDESQFTRDGINNFHNMHTWACANPHATRQTSHQHRFSVNVWAGVIGNTLIGPAILPSRVDSTSYLDFIQHELPELPEDLPLQQQICFIIMMEHRVTLVDV